MLEVTIRDTFFKVELAGEFKSIKAAREFYANELDTEPSKIEIVKAVRIPAVYPGRRRKL